MYKIKCGQLRGGGKVAELKDDVYWQSLAQVEDEVIEDDPAWKLITPKDTCEAKGKKWVPNDFYKDNGKYGTCVDK